MWQAYTCVGQISNKKADESVQNQNDCTLMSLRQSFGSFRRLTLHLHHVGKNTPKPDLKKSSIGLCDCYRLSCGGIPHREHCITGCPFLHAPRTN